LFRSFCHFTGINVGVGIAGNGLGKPLAVIVQVWLEITLTVSC